ncbi:ogr/Delta-like zinc finger family protein [Acinetobacter sp. B5B]|uniref:ogr/Delta-like zinc finger family protein n=1 Tax=Acinetobacter baretiae TaxID=2605383 RepID=UPI0018C34169|nr:ogr/Delta-like zinc finger family protein [Acinetobacter baretiae]MBF7683880.1 ogr/Delta-like zinc finger family protein [Acinetobacter baretiae]
MPKVRSSFKCPHCQSSLAIRSSKKESELFRVAYYQCSNTFCGFTARGELAITHQVTPSMIPNESIFLPTLPKHNRK